MSKKPTSPPSSPDRRSQPKPGRRSAPRKGPPPSRSRGMRSHGAVQAPRKPGERRAGSGKGPGKGKNSDGWIWGRHAVTAALANPRRTLHELWLTEAAARKLGGRLGGAPLPLPHRETDPRELDNILPGGTVHQGFALRAAPLEWPPLDALARDTDLVLVLDQVTDPHNVGAMLRLASAFGAGVLVMQSRHAPPLVGAAAKVAAGCLETVPTALVTNIANTLDALKSLGFQVTGLAGDTPLTLSQALRPGKIALVLGAEGPGLRPRVAKTCDQLARIPMQSPGTSGTAESLNVATAAAIALYEARRG